MLYFSQMSTRGSRGFTIIEVMIFLIINGVLFTSAMLYLRENQRRVEFNQAVRDFESQIRDVINDIPTGYFLSSPSLRCRVIGPSRPTIVPTGTNPLGTDNDCTYIGKALQFSPNGEKERLVVYSVIGRRLNTSGDIATTLDEARPTAVYEPSLDTTEEMQLQNGLEVTKVINGDTSAQYGIVGIISNISGSSSTSTQNARIGGIGGSNLGVGKTTAANTISALADSNFVSADQGIIICLSNIAERKASLAMGVSGGSAIRLDTGDYDTRCN